MTPRWRDQRDLERACPIRIRSILTDNGKEFTDRLFGLRRRAATGAPAFEQLCAETAMSGFTTSICRSQPWAASRPCRR
jgi:hypothetical protein